jgi:hypothetical protein
MAVRNMTGVVSDQIRATTVLRRIRQAAIDTGVTAIFPRKKNPPPW